MAGKSLPQLGTWQSERPPPQPPAAVRSTPGRRLSPQSDTLTTPFPSVPRLGQGAGREARLVGPGGVASVYEVGSLGCRIHRPVDLSAFVVVAPHLRIEPAPGRTTMAFASSSLFHKREWTPIDHGHQTNSGEAAVSRRPHRVVEAWSHPNRYRYRDRDRLGSRPRPSPLPGPDIPYRPTGSASRPSGRVRSCDSGSLVDPRDLTAREAVEVKLLVSEAHWLHPPFLDFDFDPDLDFDRTNAWRSPAARSAVLCIALLAGNLPVFVARFFA